MARKTAAIPDDPIVAEAIAEDPTLLAIPRRPRLRDTSTDDLPSFGVLVGRMTQPQRDDILRAMPQTKSRF